MIHHSFILSLNKYLLSSFSVFGVMLGTGNTMVKKATGCLDMNSLPPTLILTHKYLMSVSPIRKLRNQCVKTLPAVSEHARNKGPSTWLPVTRARGHRAGGRAPNSVTGRRLNAQVQEQKGDFASRLFHYV